jgi:hypothetical protein
MDLERKKSHHMHIEDAGLYDLFVLQLDENPVISG